MNLSSRFPTILAAVFVAYFLALAIDPISRAVWVADTLGAIFALLLYAVVRPDRNPRLTRATAGAR